MDNTLPNQIKKKIFLKKKIFKKKKFSKKNGPNGRTYTSASPQGTRPRQYRARIPNGWPAIGRRLAKSNNRPPIKIRLRFN